MKRCWFCRAAVKHALRAEKELAIECDTPDLALESGHDLHVADLFAPMDETDETLAYLYPSN